MLRRCQPTVRLCRPAAPTVALLLHELRHLQHMPEPLVLDDRALVDFRIATVSGIRAAKIDPRMKAIATVSMYDIGAVNRNALKHSRTIEQRNRSIAEVAEQRYVEFTGGETKYTSGTVHELKEDTDPVQREFFDGKR